MMLEKFQGDVPKGEPRKKLTDTGKEKRIYVSRGDDHQSVKEKITGAFHTENYLYLECIKGGNKLIINTNQQMDGREVIERRGCLYLCKSTSKV